MNLTSIYYLVLFVKVEDLQKSEKKSKDKNSKEQIDQLEVSYFVNLSGHFFCCHFVTARS